MSSVLSTSPRQVGKVKKKVLRLYLSLYQPMLDFFPKSLDEFTVPEKMDQAFCVLFAESTYVC